MNRQVKKSIAGMMLPVLQRAGRSYIAGPELRDAVAVARRLVMRGFSSTIAFWDEVGAPAEQVLAAYLSAIGGISKEPLDCYVSVKAPSLHYSRDHFLSLVEACAEKHIQIHFDSLGLESADPTFELIANLLPQYDNLTCTLPGRWARSLQDADWVIDHGIGVRVVKGQWVDTSAPGLDPHTGYLKVIERLAKRARQVAVATHNPELARLALLRLLEAGTPCQLEMLYGLPVEPALQVARSLGVSVRLYVPYGYGWLPYSLAQVRRNPRVLWWMLKDALRSSRSEIYSA